MSLALLFLLGGLGAAVGGGELVEQDGHDDVDQDVPDEHLGERSLSNRRALKTESGRSVSKQLESKESQSVPPCTQVSFWRGQPLWVCFDARCVLERTRAT